MFLLPTAYFPSVAYFSILMKEERVMIEKQEYFVKQTLRNRCTIASPQGTLTLTVPLLNEGNKTIISKKRISYAENWQIKHWRAIESSYNSSAYFEYFEEEIKKVLFEKHEFIFDLNLKLVECLLHILREKRELVFTAEFMAQGDFMDYRDEEKINALSQNCPAYYQVFKEKNGFIPNLSVLDLIFNEGLRSKDYLLSL